MRTKVWSGYGSVTIFQLLDPDPHQNDKDPQHCFTIIKLSGCRVSTPVWAGKYMVLPSRRLPVCFEMSLLLPRLLPASLGRGKKKIMPRSLFSFPRGATTTVNIPCARGWAASSWAARIQTEVTFIYICTEVFVVVWSSVMSLHLFIYSKREHTFSFLSFKLNKCFPMFQYVVTVLLKWISFTCRFVH